MKQKIKLLFLISVLLGAAGIKSADGDLDPTFNPSGTPPGIVVTLIGTNNLINSIAIQNVSGVDYIIVGGNANSQFTIARYKLDGSLDTSFGTGGSTTTSIGDNSQINSIAIQTDGKIVAGGYSRVGVSYQFTVARYNTNGSLDTTTFNSGGLQPGVVTTLISSTNNNITSIAIQKIGSVEFIVAGGDALFGGKIRFAVARYTPAGTLDTTGFAGGTGFITTPVSATDNSSIRSIAIASDNKIVAGGHALFDGKAQFAIARYNIDGTLDTTTFGGGSGFVTTQISTNSRINSIAIQTDGKIVTGGETEIGVNRLFALARYNTNGTLDTDSFNPIGAGGAAMGTVITPIAGGGNLDRIRSIAIQTNGKIVAGGSAKISGDPQFVVARYNTNGSLDTAGFNPSGGISAGTIITPIGNQGDIRSIAIQTDGKIIAGGDAVIGGIVLFALARYLSAGSGPTPTTGLPFEQLLRLKYTGRV